MIWSPPQRRAILLLLALFIALLAWRLRENPALIPNPQPSADPVPPLLLDTLDPNTATASQFAALPAIGPKVAHAIVDYREAASAQNPAAPVFQSPDDLLRVKGVGPATLAAIAPHLRFPATRPASSPP